MANDNDTSFGDKGNDVADLRSKIFEMKVLLDSLSAGFEMLSRMPAAVVVGGELTVLRTLITQTADLYEKLSRLWLDRLRTST